MAGSFVTFVDEDGCGLLPGGWNFPVQPTNVEAAISEPVGSSLFHEVCCSLSGPGAELFLVCFSVLNTSSLVMGGVHA